MIIMQLLTLMSMLILMMMMFGKHSKGKDRGASRSLSLTSPYLLLTVGILATHRSVVCAVGNVSFVFSEAI